jgi:hypothetical protein
MAIALMMLVHFSFHETVKQDQYEQFLERLIARRSNFGNTYLMG